MHAHPSRRLIAGAAVLSLVLLLVLHLLLVVLLLLLLVVIGCSCCSCCRVSFGRRYGIRTERSCLRGSTSGVASVLRPNICPLTCPSSIGGSSLRLSCGGRLGCPVPLILLLLLLLVPELLLLLLPQLLLLLQREALAASSEGCVSRPNPRSSLAGD